MRRRQKPLYGILMKAAAAALLKLAADPHYVGGLIGVMTILHTWTRTLEYHPHVHCLVLAGGVCARFSWSWAPTDRANHPVKRPCRLAIAIGALKTPSPPD